MANNPYLELLKKEPPKEENPYLKLLEKPEPKPQPQPFMGPVMPGQRPVGNQPSVTTQDLVNRVTGQKPQAPKPKEQPKAPDYQKVFNEAVENARAGERARKQDEKVRLSQSNAGNPNTTQEGTFSRDTGKIETYAPGLNPVTQENAASNVRRGVGIEKGLTIAAKGLGNIILGAQESINPELYKNIPIEDRRSLAEGLGTAVPISVATVFTGGTTPIELAANLGLGVILGVNEEDPLYNIVGNGVFHLVGTLGKGLLKGDTKAWKTFRDAVEQITPDPKQAEVIADRLKESITKDIQMQAEQVYAQQGIEGLERWAKEQGHTFVDKTKKISPETAGPVTKEQPRTVETAQTGEKIVKKPETEAERKSRIASFDYVAPESELNVPQEIKQKRWWEATDSDIQMLHDAQIEANTKGRRNLVEQALKEGKPVPAEVLADYPDLAAKYKKEPVIGKPTTEPKGETNAGKIREDTGQVRPEGREELQNKSSENLQQPKETGPKAGNQKEQVGISVEKRNAQAEATGTPKAERLKTGTQEGWKANGRKLVEEGRFVEQDLLHAAEKKLPLTKDQNGAVLHMRTSLTAKRAEIRAALDKNPTPELRDAYNAINDRIAKFDEALDVTKAESGASLASHKIGMGIDETDADAILSEMRRTTGKKPSERMTEKVNKTAERLKSVQREIDAAEAQASRPVAERKVRGARRFAKEELDKELEDIFRTYKESVGTLKNQANDITNVIGTLTYETAALVGKLGLNVAKRGINTLDDVVREVQKIWEARTGQKLSEDDVIRSIAHQAEPVKRDINLELKAKSDALAKVKRDAIRYAKEDQIAARKAGIAESKAPSRATKEAKRRIANLEKDIADLKEQIRTGNYKVKEVSKRPLNANIARLKSTRDSLASIQRSLIREANLTGGQRLWRGAGRLSTEFKLLNPVARAIDIAANTQEALQGLFGTGPAERGLANFISAKLGDDAVFAHVPLRERAGLFGHYREEFYRASQDVMPGLEDYPKTGSRGPGTWAAQELDAPFRAYQNIRYASERAAGFAKKQGYDFSETLRQILDPEVGGPLPRSVAEKLRKETTEFGNIQTLVNPNWVTRGRKFLKGYIRQSVPKPFQGPMSFVVDMTTQFGSVLVNVADKSAQYASPTYATGRALFELMKPIAKDGAEAAVRAREFVQIVRRAGVGTGVSYLGYQWYKNGGRIGDVGGVPLGPQIVETYNKNGRRTGQNYMDEGYISQLGGFMAAFTQGYRQAQIEESSVKQSQKDKMTRDMLYAPITDNPVMSNVARIFKVIDPSQDGSQTLQAWLSSIYFPGGLREWSRIQDLQEGVYGRRSEGFVQELQKKTPGTPKLPVKARPVSKSKDWRF